MPRPPKKRQVKKSSISESPSKKKKKTTKTKMKEQLQQQQQQQQQQDNAITNTPIIDITTMKNEINHHLSILSQRGNNNKTSSSYVKKLDEQGYIQVKLWPFFLQLLQQLDNNDDNDNDDNNEITKVCCHQCTYLIALIMNYHFTIHGSSSSFNNNNNNSNNLSLWNHEKDNVFQKFIIFLLQYNNNHNDDNNNDDDTTTTSNNQMEQLEIETTKIQFLIMIFTSLSNIHPTVNNKNNKNDNNNNNMNIVQSTMMKLIHIGLWSSMPTRYRELEVRKTNAYKRKWSLYCSSKSNTNDDNNDNDDDDNDDIWMEEFIPNTCKMFLKVLKQLDGQLHHDVEVSLTPTMDIDDNDDNNDDDDDDDGTKANNDDVSSILSTATAMEFLHAVLQLLLDLLSITTTRRYLRPYLLSINFSVKCTISHVFKSIFQKYNKQNTISRLFVQLVTMLQDLETFSINDLTAAPITKSEMASMYHEKAHVLQKLTHRHYPNEFSEIIYAGVGMVCEYGFLKRNLDRIVDAHVLIDVAYRLRLIEKEEVQEYDISGDGGRNFVTEVMLYHHVLRPTEEQTLSRLPLYPDEKLLWNPHLVPPGHHSFMKNSCTSSTTLALPKLNTQFLTFGDYLLRSFKLLRLESAYEIRSDIVDSIKRMRPVPRHDYDNHNLDNNLDEDELWNMKRVKTEFHGWSRMALELVDNRSCPIKILKVAPPKLGENVPSQVLAEITLDLKRCGEAIRNEWDEIGEHDNLFLVAVDATRMEGGPAPVFDNDKESEHVRVPDEEDVTFPRRFGVVAVRGCMVLEVRDSEGNILSDPNQAADQEVQKLNEEKDVRDKPKNFKRFLKVALDPAQYAADATGTGSSMGTRVYQMLNVIVRRKAKENNFKAVLETIRGLMEGSGSINKSVPSWLQPVFLGYGDPSSATFTSPAMQKFASNTVGVASPDADLDYGDTFLSETHLRESFQGHIEVDGRLNNTDEDKISRRKYRIRVTKSENKIATENNIIASSYPFPKGVNGNPVRFTPVQVKAIQSGLNPGLTLIVGPPGTGKTDVAVQIIANLYHSFPTQRTVLVTHSNAALNDLFTKVMARGDIDERYMLRLGGGERNLQTDSEFDFTKLGRVNHILSRRAKLLEKVQQISESIGVSGAAERGPDGSPSYTCETAEYFYLHHVQKRIQMFYSRLNNNDTNTSEVAKAFPFKKYFGLTTENMTLSEAERKFAELKEYFTELEEYRPLELLRSQRQRTDYLLTKQARIVAMTCTHASIARSHLIELGFQYDNILMEEAGQMLDIETFVPLLLQRGGSGLESRLKRICLIGDHHQLPPVVKNASFSRYSNLDQSLFTRLIRLGVPTIDLNKQGRSRPEISSLYNWRYKDLGNLEHVYRLPEFLRANAGFCHTQQIINVEDFEGRGESTPTAFFYQNVGEAEYAVALFQYMVLIGYPPEKISIITTYNGQKELLNDIIAQRCGENTPLGGVRPGAVSTVDHYQGQQNDFVILSLVRTKSIGHLRDIRRLVVATSRARFGLYILCRYSLFSGCHELQNVFEKFETIPKKLELVVGEQYPSQRSLDSQIPDSNKYVVDDVVALGSIVHGMQEQMCDQIKST